MIRKKKQKLYAKCAAKRKKNTKQIRGFLLIDGQTFASLAKKENITAQAISNVVHGKRHTPKVLDALQRAGVPSSLLADPREAENNAE